MTRYGLWAKWLGMHRNFDYQEQLQGERSRWINNLNQQIEAIYDGRRNGPPEVKSQHELPDVSLEKEGHQRWNLSIRDQTEEGPPEVEP